VTTSMVVVVVVAAAAGARQSRLCSDMEIFSSCERVLVLSVPPVVYVRAAPSFRCHLGSLLHAASAPSQPAAAAGGVARKRRALRD
jgi:hypothetical protein